MEPVEAASDAKDAKSVKNAVSAKKPAGAEAEIVIDGKKIGKVKIGRSDMYTVFEDKKYATRELTLVFKGLVKVYAFTFG